MENYFGKGPAKRYDKSHKAMFEESVLNPAIDFLSNLIEGNRALEFGIGTGRIALPLLKRGLQLAGIEYSLEMIQELNKKDGAQQIEVVQGDFSKAKVPGKYNLVFLVFNTITNLTSQDSQVECFINAASHLRSGGYFVIETFIPALRVLPPKENIRVYPLHDKNLDFDVYDIATQGLVSHHYVKVDSGFAGRSLPFRYVWPSELDLMARIAGMKLKERWNDWDKSPYNNESESHISVWEKL